MTIQPMPDYFSQDILEASQESPELEQKHRGLLPDEKETNSFQDIPKKTDRQNTWVCTHVLDRMLSVKYKNTDWLMEKDGESYNLNALTKRQLQ